MTVLVTDRFRAYVVVLFIVLAMGYYGASEGLRFIGSGGAHISQGDVRLGDNNHFAVLVGASIPLMLYVLMYAQSRILKVLLLGLIVVTTLAVIATYSRGGMLTLAGMGLLLILRSRKKVLGFVLVAALAITVVAVAPDAWMNRMSSVKSADSDSSFMGRVKAWKRSSQIALDRPLTGGGFQSVQSAAVFERYRGAQGLLGWVETSMATYPAAAHSIYFECMGDMGFLGFTLFLMIMISPFVAFSRGKRLARRLGPGAQWAVDLLAMLTVGQFGYLMGGASISVAYFELAYLFVALSAAVVGILEAQVRALAPPPTRLPGFAPRLQGSAA
jgi:probable O-glycosylation ligase (exosortase A-associated)